MYCSLSEGSRVDFFTLGITIFVRIFSYIYYDQHHGAKRPLHNLSPGDQVALKSDQTSKWSVPGTVVAADQPNRIYLVKLIPLQESSEETDSRY